MHSRSTRFDRIDQQLAAVRRLAHEAADSIANDYDPIKGQSGLGAVLGNELIDGVLASSARGWQAKAVKNQVLDDGSLA